MSAKIATIKQRQKKQRRFPGDFRSMGEYKKRIEFGPFEFTNQTPTWLPS
jgi:hypothetical protein